jgi:hypothetical protein
MMMMQLGLSSEGRNEKYLGLPVYVGKSKTKVFQYLKDKVWKIIQGWKERMLSKAGKEILIKACAQAIPMFAMACFDITKGQCDQISAMICRYFWAYMQKENKVHWVSWETMTLPKKEGGLGYKDLHSFNISMLAKQGWRLLTEPNSLCARVLKARYYPNCSVFQAQPSNGISYTWRSILKGIELLKEGVIKRVGNGVSVDCWNDPWIPRKWSCLPITRRGNAVVSRVEELIDPITGQWDKELVKNIFWQVDSRLILSIPVRDGMEDLWAWFYEPKGFFSVKSAYKLHRQLLRIKGNADMGETSTDQFSFNWCDIWNCPCPPNIRFFFLADCT